MPQKNRPIGRNPCLITTLLLLGMAILTYVVGLARVAIAERVAPNIEAMGLGALVRPPQWHEEQNLRDRAGVWPARGPTAGTVKMVKPLCPQSLHEQTTLERRAHPSTDPMMWQHLS